MNKPDVWVPIYIGDYLADTTRLTTEQHGAYLLLIFDYWRNGRPPDDNVVLAQITKLAPDAWSRARLAIAPLFVIDNGQWRHKRIDEEIERAKRTSTARQESGAAGAAAKWVQSGDRQNKTNRAERLAKARQLGRHLPDEWQALVETFNSACVKCGAGADDVVKDHIVPIYQGGSDALENLQPLCRSCNAAKGPEAKDFRESVIPGWRELVAKRLAKRLANAKQTPAPSPSEEKPKTKPLVRLAPHPGRFDEFWKAWPASRRKVDRKDCEARWRRKGLDAHADAIIAHVVAMKSSDHWRGSNNSKSFEPSPMTYLNGERWNDPLPPDLLSADEPAKLRVAL